MISTERYINDTEHGIEYKLFLSLIPSRGSVGWNMLVYSRKTDMDVSTGDNVPEWELVGINFPKGCEMMFGLMKEQIFDQLTVIYNKLIREYEFENSAGQ